MKMELFQKNINALENTSGDMRMLSDLQLVYMVPRNSTQFDKLRRDEMGLMEFTRNCNTK